jgi:hypothetical protein
MQGNYRDSQPTSIKEVQQLTGRITTLSRFMSKVGEKACPFFQCIKKAKYFQWTDECEESFRQVKTFFSFPSVLVQPRPSEHLMLYLSASDLAVSAALAREEKTDQQPFLLRQQSTTWCRGLILID